LSTSENTTRHNTNKPLKKRLGKFKAWKMSLWLERKAYGLKGELMAWKKSF